MSRRKNFLIVLSTLVLAQTLRAQPAYRVKDIDPRGNSTWPSSLTVSGGRLFFVLVAGIFRKQLRPQVEQAIHVAGFLILLALLVVVSIADVRRVFGG